MFDTGHTGFKGSWLSAWLDMLGAEVMGVALAPLGPPPMFQALELDSLINSQHIDINDYASLLKSVQDFQP